MKFMLAAMPKHMLRQIHIQACYQDKSLHSPETKAFSRLEDDIEDL